MNKTVSVCEHYAIKLCWNEHR